MAFQGPTFSAARAVFELPVPTSRSPEQDDSFIRAVRNDFPSLVSHQRLPPETPLQVPYVVLQSNASRLAVSATGAELDVRFFGEYSTNYGLCRDYLLRKLTGVLKGWSALELAPSLLGLLLVMDYSAKAGDEAPVAHILKNHLRVDVDPATVQDTQFRVAIRLENRYFLNLGLTNYETKLLQRPIFPGQQSVSVKPWEGTVQDQGVQLTLDINNRLLAVIQKSDPVVSPQEVEAMIGVLDRTVASVAPDFVESGAVSVAALGAPQA